MTATVGSYLFLLLLALGVWRTALWRPRPLPGVTRPRPWVLGHRGARGPHVENTVQAFAYAFRHGDGLETDVQRSRDGELVLWHDFELAGVQVGDARTAWLRGQAPDLATLADLFRQAGEAPGTLLNLEIKSRPRPLRGWALERDVVRAVRLSGLADRVLVSSFDPLALLRVRLLAPELRTGLLTAVEMPALLRGVALAGWLHVDALHPEAAEVDAALLRTARDRGLPLHVWTVNDPERMRELVRKGVGAVIGDDPAVVAKHLKG